MSQIKVYGKDSCGYCKQAMRLLDKHGIEFEYVDVEDMFFDYDAFIENIAGNMRTLPVIMNDKKQIGGFDELEALIDTNMQVAAVRKLLSTSMVRVKFTTAKGEARDVIGTTQASYLPVREDDSAAYEEKVHHPLTVSDTISIYIVDKGQWRNFNYKNVTFLDVVDD